MKPIINLRVILNEAQLEAELEQEDRTSYSRYVERTKDRRSPSALRAEFTLSPATCGATNKHGYCPGSRGEEKLPNGEVIVTFDVMGHFQSWIFSPEGELVTAVTYMEFSSDVPATRRESALERKEVKHTA